MSEKNSPHEIRSVQRGGEQLPSFSVVQLYYNSILYNMQPFYVNLHNLFTFRPHDIGVGCGLETIYSVIFGVTTE